MVAAFRQAAFSLASTRYAKYKQMLNSLWIVKKKKSLSHFFFYDFQVDSVFA